MKWVFHYFPDRLIARIVWWRKGFIYWHTRNTCVIFHWYISLFWSSSFLLVPLLTIIGNGRKGHLFDPQHWERFVFALTLVVNIDKVAHFKSHFSKLFQGSHREMGPVRKYGRELHMAKLEFWLLFNREPVHPDHGSICQSVGDKEDSLVLSRLDPLEIRRWAEMKI